MSQDLVTLMETEATLAAVLAFVDEFNHDDDAPGELLTSAENSRGSEASVCGENEAFRPRLSRRRSRSSRKDELAQLRTTAEILERQLEAQKARVAEQSAGNADEDDQLWEGVAKRQRLEHLQVKTENAELRRCFDEQLRAFKSVERALKKASKATFHRAGRQWTVHLRPWDEPCDLKGLLYAEVEDMHRNVDELFEDPRFNHLNNLERIQLVTSDGEDPSMKILTSCVLPFDHHETADVLWDIMVAQTYSGVSCQTTNSDDRVHTYYTIGRVDDQTKDAAFEVKRVSRKAYEDQHITFFSAIALDFSRLNGEIVQDVRLHVQIAHVIRQSHTTPRGNLTSWNSLYNIYPEPKKRDQRRRIVTDASKMVVQGMHGNHTSISQLLESRLMDQMLGFRV
ncbi:hypothetical protein Poli38472_004870 [Pythium oligandrum]|uniref:Uncharacterized protein n=1 Tax=Pythium oligandrum TaxID=41045 RepID=A0A8K1CBA4_PYTOL|nr:hypothetical protein Poli38472_004870 [Pythium oligandrum]|eukprot:TMW59801.1 hypothetical protein Poli38472_004870 [Pythium oligandrum]